MKLAKLSLAAIAVVGLTTSSFAADTLADAFKNGKVSGALQSYYWINDGTDINTNGVDIAFKTEAFKGLTLGLTFQSQFSPFADADAKAKYAGDMYGSGGVLSEGYLNYANSGFFLKAGRQFISTPLVAGSGSRVTKESFEGYLAGYTGVKGLTLAAGYVTKMQFRTDGAGNIGNFYKSAKTTAGTVSFDGAYTALAAYSKGPVSANVQYLNVLDVAAVDDVSVIYVDGGYTMPMGDNKVAINAQYLTSSGIAGLEGDSMGAKVSMNMGAFSGHLAYNTNGDNDNIVAGAGNGADPLYAGGLIYGNNYGAGVNTIGVGLGYSIGGAAMSVRYSDYGGTADYNTLGGQVKYSMSGALKGLGLLVQYDTKNVSGGNDVDYFRFKANYKF